MKYMQFKNILLSLCLCLLLCLLASAKVVKIQKGRLLPLSSIHIIDRNGLTETISQKDRLKQFQDTNFLSSQPYQKVLRIYARDQRGNIRAVVNTYHENGNPKQFLEIVNGRAYGAYCEWHENGNPNLLANVISGVADVTPAAERSWLFDGQCYAWDDSENMIAEINYCQGVLHGVATHYHTSGKIWKLLPYQSGELTGLMQIFRADGELLQQTNYVNGVKEGLSLRYWSINKLASCEEYCNDKLENAQYFDQQGSLIAEVKEGSGFRAILGKEHIKELQEYRDGALEGVVNVFNSKGRLKRIYHVKNAIKHGEEIEYLERGPELQPKLSFNWCEGKVQGLAKTWYNNGMQESQKEMANSKKHGLSSAWYKDGQLMMIEEYEDNKLIRGDYFKKGEKSSCSNVIQGKGTCTIFDADGHFIQKIPYCNGIPDSS